MCSEVQLKKLVHNGITCGSTTGTPRPRYDCLDPEAGMRMDTVPRPLLLAVPKLLWGLFAVVDGVSDAPVEDGLDSDPGPGHATMKKN